MDWLKSVADWLHTPEGLIAFVIILLTSIITTIVAIAIPALGKLIRKSPKYLIRLLKKRWGMFKDFCYWHQYHPYYGITYKGDVKVERIDTSYKMTLSIALSCENRDDLEILSLNCESLSIKIKPRKIKERKQSYCLKYGIGERLWRIHPLKKLESADYTLVAWSQVMPRLGDSVLCEPLNVGNVTLKGINKILRLKSSCIRVDWGNINATS